MKISKYVFVVAIVALLLSLSIVAAFLLFPRGADPISTGTDGYGDLLQYEWPQFQGDASFTHFSEGPAPETSDVLWKTNITGIQSYVSAFNGKVFVTNKTAVFALDKEDGAILWCTSLPAPGVWPAVYKIDDFHLVVGNSSLDIETGRILWTSNEFSASTAPLFTANVYSPEEKMFYTKVNSDVQAWDFSNPDEPPTMAWSTYVSGGGFVGSGVQYGDGKVFPGSFETHQIALDARNGKVLWDTPTKGSMLFSGAYYDGLFIRAGSHDNTIYSFNADTGEVLWTFNPDTKDGYFCVCPAVAYGKVYALNRDGHLYAIDAAEGSLVWKYKGPGPLMFPGNPTVADGKVYATTGQAESYTAEYTESEFACLDAYTGKLLWKLPIEAFAPRESVAIAYGRLYLIPGNVTTAVDSISGDEYSTMNEIWAIGPSSWAMWRSDPVHSASGQSGPTNLFLRWSFATGGAVVSSPSIVDGRVYFGSQDKNIYALDARSGMLFWKFATDGPVKSSPAVSDGRVYVGPDDGNVYCVDAYTGRLLWSKYLCGDIQVSFGSAVILRSSPMVVGSRVYVGCLDSYVYCLDAYDGEVIWKHKTDGYITSSPAVDAGAVYVSSQEPVAGALYKLNANDGQLVWKKSIPYQRTFTGGTDMHASPTVAEGMVFASSNVKEYYGIDVLTGETVWTYRDESAEEFIVCSTIFMDGQLFLIDKFSIVCVDASSGNTVWATFLGEELYVSPSIADGKIYVVTDQRSVFVVNATNGEKLGYCGTGSNSWSSPTIYERRVYFGNNDWKVYCLSELPHLESSITSELSSLEIVLGDSVRVDGQVQPPMSEASILISFVRPDSVVEDFLTLASAKGEYAFEYIPNVVGNWTVIAQWQSDKGYYASAYSEPTILQVSDSQSIFTVPTAYLYLTAMALIAAGFGMVLYTRFRRNKKGSTI